MNTELEKLYTAGHGDDFSMGKYIALKTGKLYNTTKFANDIKFDKRILNLIETAGFTKIQESEYFVTPKQSKTNCSYEKRIFGDLILINASEIDGDYFDEPEYSDEIKSTKKNQYRISFAYTCTNDVLKDTILNDIAKLSKQSKEGKIHLLKATSYGFETEEFKLPKPKIDLELNYGKDFVKINDSIVTALTSKKEQRGRLVLLHGLPGTGKTTYIKWLANHMKRKVLFLPPILAESIVNPDFVPFLMDNKDCILVIEDAEKIIGDRNNSYASTGVSNILNLTDGILGDILNISIIATFNMDKEKIDSALLRKGRLIAEHKFDKLNVEDTNILIKHLGMDNVVDKGMTLADIYNINTEQFKTVEDKPKIGFGR
jgi:hypothetical protein